MEGFASSEMGFQRFWSRRIAGQYNEDDVTADVLLENQLLFPPAQVQVEDDVRKRRLSSPCVPCILQDEFCECQGSSSKVSYDVDVPSSFTKSNYVPGIESLDGRNHNDIPCMYTVPKSDSHEMTAAGVCVDPSILPGFIYKIRPLSFNGKTEYLFGGEGRELESVGRGYSRRITLKPLKGQVNSNQDYFWTDSNPEGFAFSIQVLAPQEKFTLFDADHQPVGHVEITRIQGAQTELSQTVLKDGTIEKLVRVRALCKVDWFHEQDNNPIVPLSGVCLCVRGSRGSSKLVQIRDAKLGAHHGYILSPGTCTSLRSLRVSGANKSDIPTSYTIVGIDIHHLPVIGTYVDERIVPGFYYRVQLGGCGRQLFGGRALRLDSLGRGYAKRITFSPEVLNRPEEHFWSDSHPEGFGFEISAVRPGMKFVVKTKDSGSILGHAQVFRDDCAHQVELLHTEVNEEKGSGVLKKVQIDVKCVVTLDLSTKEDLEPHVMRVSGLATLFKLHKQAEARVVKIEDIGLDSQLNVLFFNQWKEMVFYPITL